MLQVKLATSKAKLLSHYSLWFTARRCNWQVIQFLIECFTYFCFCQDNTVPVYQLQGIYPKLYIYFPLPYFKYNLSPPPYNVFFIQFMFVQPPSSIPHLSNSPQEFDSIIKLPTAGLITSPTSVAVTGPLYSPSQGSLRNLMFQE